MRKLKRYKLIKEFDNSPKLNTIIEECYSVPMQYVNQQSPKRECYHPPFDSKYWKELPKKSVIIIH